MVIADDGKGFDPDAAERSFGLVGMQERVTLSGGLLEIESAPGRGTEVRAQLSLPDQAGTGGLIAEPVEPSPRS